MKLENLVVEGEESEGNGTFVGVHFTDESCDKLLDMMDDMRIEKPTDRDDLHVTVMYSPKPIPEFVEDHPEPVPFNPPSPVTGEKFHVFPSDDGNALVMFISSEYLHERHNEIIDAYGAEYTFDKYHPHVTLTYSPDEIDLDQWNVDEYDVNLELSEEYNEPLTDES